jgi:hypothetical protein
MRLPALLATSVLLALSVGCLQSIDYVDQVDAGFFTGGIARDLNFDVRDARLSGRFGPTETFSNADATASGYDDDSSTNLVLETRRGGQLGMLIIDSWSGSLRTMPAGRYTSSSTDMESEVYVSVCATEFDAPASDAEIVIEDRPDGARVVTVEATVDGEYDGVDNRDNPAIGRFTLVR